MRIIHVIPNIERGGAERALLGIAKYALGQGHEVRIVVLGDKNAYPEETSDALRPTFLHFRHSYRSLRDVIRCRNRSRDIIRSWRADIVHSHLWPAARMAGWALEANGPPHIVHIHGSVEWLAAPDLRSRAMRFLTRTALRRRNTHFIAVGKAVAEYTHRYLPFVPRHIPVVYNGFDESRFSRLPRRDKDDRDTTVFGTAARLVPNKGIDRLLRALQQARIEHPWTLLVAGDGSQQPLLQSLATELGLAERVRFLGTITEMREFYHQLDVYVQPSLSLEGLPLVLTEAMACGLPVIATDVGATRELVRDGVDGSVIPPDDVPALTRTIETLAADPEKRWQLGANAQKRAWAEFTSRKMGEKVLKIYADVLHKGGLNC